MNMKIRYWGIALPDEKGTVYKVSANTKELAIAALLERNITELSDYLNNGGRIFELGETQMPPGPTYTW